MQLTLDYTKGGGFVTVQMLLTPDGQPQTNIGQFVVTEAIWNAALIRPPSLHLHQSPDPIGPVSPVDLVKAVIHHSPLDIASWLETVQITHVSETATGGYVLTFNIRIPDSWKFFTQPDSPSQDNIQFTVWIFLKLAGVWHGAGFCQMWQDRTMGDGSLPPIFAGNPPGYTNWWGDIRHLWEEMSDYIPTPGDQIGFLISAGNARLQTGVTSVRERSNVYMVPLVANDTLP